MLRRQHVTFGMGHQSHDSSGRIADAGNVSLGAVRVGRIHTRLAIRSHVAEDSLARLLHARQLPLFAAEEAALAVGDGKEEPVGTLEERTLSRSSLEVDPAVLELSGG